MTRTRVSDSELAVLVAAEIASADGPSELSTERSQNMDYYQCRPFGNELEGRSSIVSSDVRDVVEWILPTLIRIFCSGEEAVEFEPESAADIAAAAQATQYVNFIWNRDNRGFVNFYSWFKDALLQKNGVLKIWWDDTTKTRRERYQGLDEAAFVFLAADPDVEVSEHTETVKPAEIVRPGPDGPVPETVELFSHDLVITRKIPGGRVRIVPVPPEEFLISHDLVFGLALLFAIFYFRIPNFYPYFPRYEGKLGTHVLWTGGGLIASSIAWFFGASMLVNGTGFSQSMAGTIIVLPSLILFAIGGYLIYSVLLSRRPPPE